MTMKLIPNAALYRVVLPAASDLAKHLATIPHTELKPSHGKGSGFVPVPYTGEMVHTFVGGFAFSLRYDEKILPGSVITAEVKKRAADMEAHQGYKPGRKAIKELREMVAVELLQSAFIRTKVVTCLYHTESQTLIVPTISGKLKSEIMGQLVRAVESLKTTTIHVSNTKGSLTTRLANYLRVDSVDAFEGFTVGGKAVLSGEGGKTTFDLAVDLCDHADGLMESVRSGAEVIELALSANGVNFRLTSDFMLKGIKFDDEFIQYDQDPADARYTFEQEAAVQVLLVSKVVDALCEMFGYTPPADDGDDLC